MATSPAIEPYFPKKKLEEWITRRTAYTGAKLIDDSSVTADL